MIDERTLAAGIEATFAQAQRSFDEGGVPIGSALVVDGAVVAVGHNRRVQSGSNVLHGETDCIENAGHRADFARATLFTSLSPCAMCAGAILLFRIPRVVILDSENTADFATNEAMLREAGVEVIGHPHAPSIALNRAFQTDPRTRPVWLGDVGTE